MKTLKLFHTLIFLVLSFPAFSYQWDFNKPMIENMNNDPDCEFYTIDFNKSILDNINGEERKNLMIKGKKQIEQEDFDYN